MPYSIGDALTVDTHFGLYWSAKQAALERSEATGDVVVIRDDLSFQIVALVLGDVVFVPEKRSTKSLTLGGRHGAKEI